MSKDIWHLPPETPDVFRVWQILVIYEAGDQREFMASNEFSWRTANRYVNRWCYVDDLLELETENKDLSDKIGKLETELEKTRKALEIAVDALDAGRTLARIAGFEMLATGMDEAVKQITEPEQKDKR